jgi:hypothetical protein
MTGFRHGFARPESRSPTYRSWECARSRCRNANNPDFKDYGGRGVSFYSGWDSFQVFLADMGHRPPGHTLDRIDNQGNYEPGNCRWATPSTQQANKRDNQVVIYQGRTMILADLARETGVPYQRLHERIVRRGWDVERAVSTPTRQW